MRRHFVALALLAAATVGCERGADPAQVELAAELRALRQTLAVVPPAAGSPAASPVDERRAVGEALAPMREALDGLLQAQRDLAARQLSLTQELQRWTALLATGLQGAPSPKSSADAAALAQRLAELERTMADQDQRHREVEALLQGALDRTAERLEDFLNRVEQLKPAGTGTAVPVAPTGHGAGHGGDGSSPQRGGWPWPAALAGGFALVVALLLLRRLVQPDRAAALPRSAESPPDLAAAAPHPERAAVAAGEVDQIWAAAALLGEAVGKLRSQPAVAAEPSTVGGPHDVGAPEHELDLDDIFVVDDLGDDELADNDPGDNEPAAGSAPAAAPVVVRPPAAAPHQNAPAPTIPAPSPGTVTCRLRVRDADAARSAVVRLLLADPRVLLHPGPRLTEAGSELHVAFGVLPGLPAGERSQLEQSLRDAVA